MNRHYTLPPSHTITVTSAGGSGSGFARQVENPSIGSAVLLGSPVTFGPYLLDRTFVVQGDVTVAIAESDASANIPTSAQKALLAAIPTEDQEDGVSVWNDEGVLKVSTGGA